MLIGGLLMEQKNKKIIEEYLLLNKAFRDTLHSIEILDGYSWYKNKMNIYYMSLNSKYINILGIQNLQTHQEAISVLSNMELTSEQKRALKVVQKDPVFKKLMGETAISKKGDLEKVLGQEITCQGMTYADEREPRESVKSVEVLENERQAIYDKLSIQLSSGTITEEQYRNFLNQTDYIYNYYESISMAEQIPFRKISDAEITKIQSKADEEGISFNEAFDQRMVEMIEDFKTFHAEINGAPKQEATINNPKYDEFKTEIDKKKKDIESLQERKKQIEALLDETYKRESQIGKDLPFEESSYQKLVAQIKEKELEIKVMDIEALIKNSKNWISQKKLGLLRMEGAMTPQQYSFQIEEAKTNYSINDNYENMTHTYEENELYSMQMRLLGMQAKRGEITEEQRNVGYQELKEKIGKNDEYISSLQEDLSSERRKQIEKQIAFRYSQGMITKETRQAQLDALANIQELTGQSQVDISNVYVDEQNITHRTKR
jgi:hypothetical protein